MSAAVRAPDVHARALAALNALSTAEAEAALLRCCGSSRWARLMAVMRPFHTKEALTDSAADVWQALAPQDWLQAFAAHPRIGAAPGANGPRAQSWSAREQSGITTADAVVRRELERLNAEYESRFGHRFIVCATGLSAEEMLSSLKSRVSGDPSQELRIAAAEQAGITELRLEKLLTELAEA
ncbi:MAG TPA: 2-oxo-4-hydroxy-4-carboxy-5-ureidoimidazoline decarboxylase [Gemmatimonadaceae bacterium]|nr:2-oxo-4-hydroxy-4-carboxy-5-ureidoimidazoline decarboxylase [Gemmatimonadaceae bacterium]